ncbi:MAG: threonine synthase [Candidatus Syntrophonatronum acetioxidans]|uniref:Threonine synthase n=1 Tax=Candidatus Syntrophonatronum acetioxidans TaxID=1795816 RepID=A0A424YBC3_9FIRM|nr:MAG: threonine synthase [Candidatus Syntrophonatronum acetioxidans]
MQYISTRNNFNKVSASKAIKLGMVPAGGLFVPERIPRLALQEIENMGSLPYQQLAQEILSLYLGDYTFEEIGSCASRAYHDSVFNTPEIAPLRKINDCMYILELWHGPTAAFKDMALQIMPYLLSLAMEKNQTGKETVILVATSGDTGKAALEGFKDVEGLKIIVFYPKGGVSKIQELQMTSTGGQNTFVVSVEGNFDDCQNAVKNIFSDREFNLQLEEKGFELSSANSINWGRLAPQIVYYFWSYLQMLTRSEINIGDKVNICVPTGNFGNILAAFYAGLMGLPVKKLICASNENKVLADFINTGVYDRRRELKKTMSPSMDILVSSNLERFLFELADRKGNRINSWFEQLQKDGFFEINLDTLRKVKDIMTGDFATEEETLYTIKNVYHKYNYLIDTHTAVGINVYKKYMEATSEKSPTIIVSTANPYKFNTSVLKALKGKEALIDKDEFDVLEEIKNLTGIDIHPGLKDLDKKEVRHKWTCSTEKVKEKVKEILSL